TSTDQKERSHERQRTMINVLNQVLRKELTGINQYFIHAKMCQNWGYEKLRKVLWDESIGEMKHADQIIQRILFLEGVPNISAYDKILVGTGVKHRQRGRLQAEVVFELLLHARPHQDLVVGRDPGGDG